MGKNCRLKEGGKQRVFILASWLTITLAGGGIYF
jgi:hypothetical protein